MKPPLAPIWARRLLFETAKTSPHAISHGSSEISRLGNALVRCSTSFMPASVQHFRRCGCLRTFPSKLCGGGGRRCVGSEEGISDSRGVVNTGSRGVHGMWTRGCGGKDLGPQECSRGGCGRFLDWPSWLPWLDKDGLLDVLVELRNGTDGHRGGAGDRRIGV